MILPELISLSNWAASLVIDFPRDNIPFLKDEKDWKVWGNTLIQENSFAANGAPGTSRFNEWKPWATAVFKAMASN